MVNVHNPHNEAISMTLAGVDYSIPAGGDVLLPSDVADHWKKNVHEFIQVSDVKSEATPKPKAEPKAEVVTPTKPVDTAPKAVKK